jgi:hypothetical protein
VIRTRPLLAVAVVSFAAILAACPATSKRAGAGDWNGKLVVVGNGTDETWVPGQTLTVKTMVYPSPGLGEMLKAAGTSADKLVVLVTAERTFDADGWLRLPSDEGMSTLLTPTGIPVEGGNPGPVTERFGYSFHTPVDVMTEHDFTSWPQNFEIPITLPDDSTEHPLPPGLYRIRTDFGVKTKDGGYVDLSGYGMGSRPFLPRRGSYLYSGLHPTLGSKDVLGNAVDATQLQARLPWTLLAQYNSNGYAGAVADEDSARFGLSSRNLIQDDVILPLYWGSSKDDGSKISYSLEPTLPADRVDAQSNLQWDFTKGELSLEITNPDGTVVTVGPAPVVGKTDDGGPTTRNPAFTDWRPLAYGKYTVKLTGSIYDQAGRRYTGGGTYRFWIAKRMTMATATFQGNAYPVGFAYGRDMAFNPPLPADVTWDSRLYLGSDPSNVVSATRTGKATAGGIYGVPAANRFALSAPGEYWAHVVATATDAEGHLWVSSMRHAGVVYAADTPVEAHGKKLYLDGTGWAAQGETHREGEASLSEYESPKLEHVNFPWNQSDILLIASDGGGANKIEPVLTWSPRGEDNWDGSTGGIGVTNLMFRTSNGLSPHLFPEYITDREYFYASAARPGFMPRFLVGESTVRAPYWSTSPNYFGGQIAASSNGDLVGDLYRLIGGVAKRDVGQPPVYAGYLATASLLPKGTKNNRVVAPGAEDLTGSTGEKNRFFLVGYRPGMAVAQGAAWTPAIQVDPQVPATIHVDLMDATGATLRSWEGLAKGGTYSPPPTPTAAEPAPYALTTPGVYRYRLVGTWVDNLAGSPTAGQTFTSTMPGLLDNVGEFYVFTADCLPDGSVTPCRPAGAAGLTFDLPNTSSMSATTPTVITGHSTTRASGHTVHYALIMPGAVLAQGELPVQADGTFTLTVSPSALHATAPIYDIASVTDHRALLPGRVLHLTFMSEETAGDGTRFWDFHRVVVRGSTMVSAARSTGVAAAAGDGHPAWIPR